MLKIDNYYYPSLNLIGEWYFIVENKEGLSLQKTKPQKGGMTLDKATTIENKLNYQLYKSIDDVAKFINGILPRENDNKKSFFDKFRKQ